MNEQDWHCDSQWHRSQACNRSRWPSRPITRLRTGSVALRIQAPVCEVEVYWLRPKVWRMFVWTMNLIHMNRQWNTKWRKPYITVVVEEVYIETGTKQADVSAVCVCVYTLRTPECTGPHTSCRERSSQGPHSSSCYASVCLSAPTSPVEPPSECETAYPQVAAAAAAAARQIQAFTGWGKTFQSQIMETKVISNKDIILNFFNCVTMLNNTYLQIFKNKNRTSKTLAKGL